MTLALSRMRKRHAPPKAAPSRTAVLTVLERGRERPITYAQRCLHLVDFGRVERWRWGELSPRGRALMAGDTRISTLEKR